MNLTRKIAAISVAAVVGLTGLELGAELGIPGVAAISDAQARVGRPATPLSVAGVARRTTRRVVRRTRAGPPSVGQTQQPCSRIGGVRFPRDVAAVDELVDELSGGLLRDAEVLGEVGRGGVAGADPGEGESVRRPDVGEPACGDALLDGVDQLARGPQDEYREIREVGHGLILTERSRSLTI